MPIAIPSHAYRPVVNDFSGSYTREKGRSLATIQHSKVSALKQFHTFSWPDSNLDKKGSGRAGPLKFECTHQLPGALVLQAC